jgi:protein-ribulosamine 3-kinase
MISDQTLHAMAAAISETGAEALACDRAVPVGGGSINACYRLEADGCTYFAKLNRAAGLSMFEAERDGLTELATAGSVRVPEPVCTGQAGDVAFLIMEYIPFGRPVADSAARLGRGLAEMHRHTGEAFGWWRDNTIGSTSQPNEQNDDWVSFWRQRRLGHQLRLAAANGFGGALQRRGERLLAELPAFFTNYRPLPSLLHGDLWGGNYAVDGSGAPVIFDPAVYYGDRETDLAMTKLFGGFSEDFYAAYREAWPLDAGYRQRETLYKLYHVLNHANLFGGGYARQAEGMMDQLLSELG